MYAVKVHLCHLRSKNLLIQEETCAVCTFFQMIKEDKKYEADMHPKPKNIQVN